VKALTPKGLAIRLKMFSGNGEPNLAGLAKWRFNGEGPKWLRIGKVIRYPLSGVEQWEKEQMEERVNENKKRD
jgi:hypothetical protein